jgi:hypothetical protein
MREEGGRERRSLLLEACGFRETPSKRVVGDLNGNAVSQESFPANIEVRRH